MTAGEATAALVDQHDALLLDLDGVVYVGDHAVPHAVESTRACRRKGIRLAYVTNNASRPPEVTADHLRQLGIELADGDVVTSAQAAAQVLTGLVLTGSRVLVVGGDGLRAALRERGLVPVDDADVAVAVVQGFSPDVGWRLLAEGSYAVARGIPWVASNTDRSIPTPRGVAPGNGTLVEAVAAATGRQPDVVAGKPERPLVDEAVRRMASSRPLIVGDRLDTDIEAGVRAGIPTLLVMTGVTQVDVLLAAEAKHRPTYVGADLRTLLTSYDGPQVDGEVARCGGWSASVARDEVRLDGSGSAEAALRAAACAAWSHTDRTGVPVRPDDQLRRLVAGLADSRSEQ